MSDSTPTPGAPEDIPDVIGDGFKYYIFDWDDNILHMPTRIHLERRTESGAWVPHSVSTSAFAVLRNDQENYRPPEGDWEKAFIEFRDLDPDSESAFLRDAREALDPVVHGEDDGGPSFQRFKQALIEGRLFAIVTARGHNASSIRAGVEYFIREVLSPVEMADMLNNLRAYRDTFGEEHDHMNDAEVLKKYLDLNRYHAVTSPEFKHMMGVRGPGSESPEEAKQFAIKDFVQHAIEILRKSPIDRPISVGFSDDDPHNIRAVQSYVLKELGREFPGVRFVVYDTSDPDVESGHKIIVTGQLELDFGEPGSKGA